MRRFLGCQPIRRAPTANGYRALGDAGAAESAYRRALGIRERAQGPDHPDVAYPLYHLGSLYLEQGRLAEAEPFHRRARLLAEQALEPDHPLRVSTSKDLAALLRQTGREAEAAALEARATAGGDDSRRR